MNASLRKRRPGGVLRCAAAALPVLLATALLVPTASAVKLKNPAFYETPAVLPAADGALIRSEPMEFALDPLKVHTVRYTAERILYSSRARTGKQIAVSGTVIVPKTAWKGPGRRPVIGYAPGTQGIGDVCAPSRKFTGGLEYEGLFIIGMLAKGWAIAMTDYEGLGTEGMHTYADRVAEGRAVIDGVRAAQALPGDDVDATSPVAFYGYSQGGQAAASAAELAGTYGKGLDVKGTVAGAAPSDLTYLPGAIDGSLFSIFGWFAIHGLTASYDIDMTPYLNAEGRQVYDDMKENCVMHLFNGAFKKSSRYTVDGAGLAELITREPFRTVIDDQRVGRIKPSAPVLVTHSYFDDVVPIKVGQQLVKDWCGKGATVKFSPNLSPLHVGGMLNNATEVYAYLDARFAGKKAPTSC
ncbi:lipase family protein [Nocardioides yefusunii]|uniref:Lipase family protein n=1 Tax=Nocardioides yefusunii TaxID=2500546 RepID=A0ABW1QRP0_9ACTN|nr:lipase family protein [Nocardioides yefusunii]